MIKPKEKIDCKVFHRPVYCLQVCSDCKFCKIHIDKHTDCQNNNSSDNYQKE